MINSKFHIFDLFDIPVYIDISLVVLLLMFVTDGGGFLDGITCALLLLFSITAHEFGHALTARSFGYDTRDITLSLLGGCASLIALPRRASQEFLTAVAGPAVSFALSLVGVACITALASEGGFFDALDLVMTTVVQSFGFDANFSGTIAVSPSVAHAVEKMAYFAIMNAMLGLFNLLPGFPMDGGRVFRSAMRPFLSRPKATYVAMVVGRVVAVAIALSGVWRLLNGRSWGLVSMLIAWMIWKEGYREYQLARMESSWEYEDFRVRVSPPPYGDDN
jgi:Zn-dependent protease